MKKVPLCLELTGLISEQKKYLKSAIIFCRKSRAKGVSHERYIYGTAKVMSKGQVTIPKRIRELLNLENGDYITFVVNKDRVEIQNSNVFIEENIKK
ncbi:AbrB/MazE/SpoVT family DNA-binding domain-containing protein [Tuanshanicoccus lijuaniae]|uniref:AbrB/MazE/SpoVT family DNA-binding domain-containing protein n=1 Tax=Aerococcaceae bacterium zg-1292 TaxID=2774330 RepID=UPI004064906A